MFIKVGGANGSGKSTLANAFMLEWNFTPVTNDKGKPLEYVAKPRQGEPLFGKFKQIVVLGDYRSVCGGMDSIGDKNLRLQLIQKYMNDKKSLVFFEGVLVGNTYGEIGALSEQSKVLWLYAMMDTPYELCVERVLERRKAKGNDKEFNPEKNLKRRMREVTSVFERAAREGHLTHWVNHKHSPSKQVKTLLTVIGGKE